MSAAFRPLLYVGRALLAAEALGFVYWCVTGAFIIGRGHPDLLVAAIIAAFHYGSAAGVYAGVNEIAAAYEKHADEPLRVGLANSWLALNVVALVTDVMSLALALGEHPEDALLGAMLVVLAVLFLVLTVLGAVWLVVLRVAIARQPPPADELRVLHVNT